MTRRRGPGAANKLEILDSMSATSERAKEGAGGKPKRRCYDRAYADDLAGASSMPALRKAAEVFILWNPRHD